MKRLFIFVLLCLSFSCSKNKLEVELNPSVLEGFDVEHSWIVVTEPYAASREQASYDSPVVKNYRRGAIDRVEGECTVKVDDNYEVWYALSDGWISSRSVRKYITKLRAESEARSMEENSSSK